MHVLNWNPPQLPQYIGEGGARGEGIHLIVKRLKGGTIRAQDCKAPPLPLFLRSRGGWW